jgi:hypothetical protein
MHLKKKFSKKPNPTLTNLKVISTGQGYIHKYEALKEKIYNCITNVGGCNFAKM